MLANAEENERGEIRYRPFILKAPPMIRVLSKQRAFYNSESNKEHRAVVRELTSEVVAACLDEELGGEPSLRNIIHPNPL